MNSIISQQEQIKELIKRRRHQVLVHSYIYYRLYDSIISNETFDNWANELISLQANHPDLSAEVELYDVFKSFTSIHCALTLPFDDERLASKAKWLLDYHHTKMCE